MVAVNVRKVDCSICLQVPKVCGRNWVTFVHEGVFTQEFDGSISGHPIRCADDAVGPSDVKHLPLRRHYDEIANGSQGKA